jgi:hypothetical protein
MKYEITLTSGLGDLRDFPVIKLVNLLDCKIASHFVSVNTNTLKQPNSTLFTKHMRHVNL